ncbi:MAG: BatD family protein [Gammaproteobacteria bacterium]|nr:BatD family protein [Gammaproteobacteria bacterium]
MVVRLIVYMFLLAASGANAAVTASIDRADVDLNESFTLDITTDLNVDAQPDVTVLETDFLVGQSSFVTNTTILNGQIRRSKTWSYVLMPKRAGQLTIPPISIGGEFSNPLVVEISEPSYAPPGEAEVFVTTEVDTPETYVQAQLLLTVKIYRSVAVRQPALRDPVVSGAEVLLELAGDDRSYEAVIGGTPYGVIERVIAIYPQESGEIQLSPARFEARVLRDGRITGRKIYESEPLTVTVLPTPAPPARFPNANWLPARDLTLTEDWSQQGNELKAGEPLTRRISIEALGQLETQIPAIEPPTTEGISVYPDKPELSRRIEPGGIRGIRQDQYALIGVRAGDVQLPALEVPWWNTESKQWQIATLPQRTITIIGAEEPEIVTPIPDASDSTAVTAVTSVAVQSEFWRRVSEALAVLLLLTCSAWWWSARSPAAPRTPREPAVLPTHKRQAALLKKARTAALAADAAGVRAAIIAWGQLQWPDNAPRSIGAIADRVSSPLAEELRALSRQSYGPEAAAWDGAALARGLRSFAILSEQEADDDDLLPPLLPPTSVQRSA